MNLKPLYILILLNVLSLVPLYSTEEIIEQEVRDSMRSHRNYNPEQDYQYHDVEQEVDSIQSSDKSENTTMTEPLTYEERVKRVMNCGLKYDPEEDCYRKTIPIDKSVYDKLRNESPYGESHND